MRKQAKVSRAQLVSRMQVAEQKRGKPYSVKLCNRQLATLIPGIVETPSKNTDICFKSQVLRQICL